MSNAHQGSNVQPTVKLLHPSHVDAARASAAETLFRPARSSEFLLVFAGVHCMQEVIRSRDNCKGSTSRSVPDTDMTSAQAAL